jgi:serine O-acetyltransferase
MTKNTVSLLLDSYKKIGFINGSDGVYYPSKNKVVIILNLIKELLFPGFFGNNEQIHQNLDLLTEELLNKLHIDLSTEVTKCLHWNPQVEKRLEKEVAIKKSSDICDQFFKEIIDLRTTLKDDAQAMFDGDPAANSIIEVILAYPGFQAVIAYRIGHFFHVNGVPLIPRMMTEIAHEHTGIDIHPGATIGHHFCIDHGTGLVIGETAIIGNHVKLYQGVTLGAFSTKKGDSTTKRHPTLKDYVTVYSMSTILGGDTVIGENSVVGGNVWLTKSLEPNSKIYVSDFSKSYTLITKEQ